MKCIALLAVSGLATLLCACSSPGPNPAPADAGGGASGGGGSSGGPGSSGDGSGGTSGAPDGGGGAAGSGKMPRSLPCPSLQDVQVEAFARRPDAFDPGFVAMYAAPVRSPELGGSDGDEVNVDFFEVPELMLDGASSGTFDLVQDSNPNTCSRCVRIVIDGAQSEFLAQSGTLTVDSSANPVNGTVEATLTDVTLSLVGGAALPGIACLHIVSATVSVTQ